MSEKNASELAKIYDRIGSMYLKADRSVFLVNFNKFERMVKINTRIREIFTEKEDIAKTYAAISFFDKMSKKQSFDESYKISSEYYNIPEKVLRSVVGTRNANKRHGLKA